MTLPPALRAVLEAALPANTIVSEPEQLRTYECDAVRRPADGGSAAWRLVQTGDAPESTYGVSLKRRLV